MKEVLERDTSRVIGRWPVLKDDEVLEILRRLAAADTMSGTPVYISGGEVISIGEGGKLRKREERAAMPTLWPIAHDVRPKSRSLGVRGCDDCHSTDSPFHFGLVDVVSPFAAVRDTVRHMTDYQDITRVSAWIFSMSFLFRPGLKWLVIICFLLVASVVLISMVRGLAHLIRILAAGEE